MIIDCHIHLPESGLSAMLHRADIFGIERLCMFALGNEVDVQSPPPLPIRHWPSVGAAHHTDNWNPPPERITASNILVESMINEVPDRLSALCFVNPQHRDHALEEIRNHVRDGAMIGIKLWISCKANDPLVEPIAAYAVELDVPILQHCWNKYGGNMPRESSTRDIAELAVKFPELKIIAAHLPGQGEAGILDLAPHPNVYLDTSGMAADAGILEFAKDVVGSRRILFGSDAPYRSFESALARVQGCPLTDEERSDILAKNFNRLFSK